MYFRAILQNRQSMYLTNEILFSRIKDTNLRKIKSHDNFSNLTTGGGGTKPLADLEKRKKGKS